MTPDQLDEIEKLAEAMHGAVYHASGDYPEERFMALACNSASPLVKALREARQEHERNRAEWDSTVAQLTREVFRIAEERDEARANVERLREAIRGALTNGHMNALCWAKNDAECVGRCRVLREALG